MTTQYLIAVTTQSPTGLRDRTTYRVPTDATLFDVVRAACQRSQFNAGGHLPYGGHLPLEFRAALSLIRCTGLEILGTLEPHLWDTYQPLLEGK